MEESIREFFGRAFSAEEIELIQWTAKTYSQLSRHELANTICEFLDWKQINGKPKSMQSTKFLQKLEEEGLIHLQSHGKKKASNRGAMSQSNVLVSETSTHPGIKEKNGDEITEPIKKTEGTEASKAIHNGIAGTGSISLALVETEAEKKRWKTYVGQYHMLGHNSVYGAQLRYFIRSGEEDLGCLQFSASSWSLAPRDEWIGWTVQDRKKRLHLVVNNSKFLVLPWIQWKNMASRALSLSARQVQKDWLRVYNYVPVLFETFVDPAFYGGISYKAANWIYLGQTQGRGRNDRHHENAVAPKAIFVYPLHRGFREILKGDKPPKVVSPDE